jgi:glyoxylase I family protein
MTILALHHVSLLVSDTGRALAFYHGLLGLPLAERPELGFPGAWLDVAGAQIHLLELPAAMRGGELPEHVGRDSHVALQVSDLEELRGRLEKNGIPFTASRSGRAALFCRDPDGNGVELVAV